MFGMGMPEILLILAIALIVIGPKKLPDLAKSLGRAMMEFKKATSELKASFEDDSDMTDMKKTFRDMDQTIKKPVKTPVKRAIDIGPAGTPESESKALIPKEETLPAVETPAPDVPAEYGPPDRSLDVSASDVSASDVLALDGSVSDFPVSDVPAADVPVSDDLTSDIPATDSPTPEIIILEHDDEDDIDADQPLKEKDVREGAAKDDA